MPFSARMFRFSDLDYFPFLSHLFWILRIDIKPLYSSPRVTRSSTKIIQSTDFYRLDCWEDDSRRRRRFSPNPYGSTHANAVLFDPEEQAVVRQRLLEARQKEAAATISLESVLLPNGSTSPELKNEPSSSPVAPSSKQVPTSPSRNSLTEENRMPELEDFLAQYEDGIELTLSSMAAEGEFVFPGRYLKP